MELFKIFTSNYSKKFQFLDSIPNLKTIKKIYKFNSKLKKIGQIDNKISLK